jgi:hypothetical protein
MIHVSSTMWRIKNQPSNSTSCSDNALVRLLVLVVGKLYRGLQVSSFSMWGCVLKGWILREVSFEGPTHVWRASKPYIGYPYPCPWVRCYCSWVGMGGHGWVSVLCIPASSSKSESNFSDAGNTLTKSAPGWSQWQWTTFNLYNPTRTWCRWVIHITQFLNTWAQFE